MEDTSPISSGNSTFVRVVPSAAWLPANLLVRLFTQRLGQAFDLQFYRLFRGMCAALAGTFRWLLVFLLTFAQLPVPFQQSVDIAIKRTVLRIQGINRFFSTIDARE